MPSSAAAGRFARGPRSGASRPGRFFRRAGGRLHLAATLFLLVSLFAPIVAIQGALAAAAPASPQPAVEMVTQGANDVPPPLPAPTQAVVSGDLQAQLSEHRGVFTAAVPVAPGDYEVRIDVLGIDGQQRSLGQDADPNGDDLEVEVADGDAGVYIAYDYRTGEIAAESSPVLVTTTIQRSDGEPAFTVAARPDGGEYELYFSGAAGANLYEVLVNGQPVAQDQIDLPNNARVRVTLDGQGAVQNAELVPQAGLTVTKTDPSGAVLSGSCFALFDGNDLATQACDVDDGEDGNTFLLFLNGIDDGGEEFELRETLVPDGQSEAEEQDVPLNNQDFSQVTVVATGGDEPSPDETAEPEPDETEEAAPGADEGGASVTLIAVDVATQQQPLDGACFQPDGGQEVCDGDDGDEDGATTLTGLPAGAQIVVTETEAPDGGENIGAFEVQVSDGAQYLVPHPGMSAARIRLAPRANGSP